jgi:hypothetical protein
MYVPRCSTRFSGTSAMQLRVQEGLGSARGLRAEVRYDCDVRMRDKSLAFALRHWTGNPTSHTITSTSRPATHAPTSLTFHVFATLYKGPPTLFFATLYPSSTTHAVQLPRNGSRLLALSPPLKARLLRKLAAVRPTPLLPLPARSNRNRRTPPRHPTPETSSQHPYSKCRITVRPCNRSPKMANKSI